MSTSSDTEAGDEFIEQNGGGPGVAARRQK